MRSNEKLLMAREYAKVARILSKEVNLLSLKAEKEVARLEKITRKGK